MGIEKIEVDQLVIEVTRRCNASCEHCLRGPQQSVDMTKKTIDKIFDTVERCFSVTFTGGEPTLNLSVIEYFFSEAAKRGFDYGSFYLVTNGMVNQEELALMLMREYARLDDECKEYSRVALSADDFHPQVINPIIKTLGFYDSSKEHVPGDRKWIIAEGRAEAFASARVRTFNKESLFNDGEILSLEMLYVNAKGECVFDCDMSYQTQDDVAEFSLDNLLSNIDEEIRQYAHSA